MDREGGAYHVLECTARSVLKDISEKKNQFSGLVLLIMECMMCFHPVHSVNFCVFLWDMGGSALA